MNLIYILLFGENFMCVYRNYLLLTKSQKIAAIIRVVLEISLSTTIIVNNIILIYKLAPNENMSEADKLIAAIFQILVLFKCFVIIIGGIVNCEKFKKFYVNVRSLYNSYKDDAYFIKSQKNLKVKCLIGFIVFSILSAALLLIRLGSWHDLETDTLIKIIILMVHEIWVDIRYIMEHIVVFCAIKSIYDYLKCLTISVNEVLQKYSDEENNRIARNAHSECNIFSEKVNRWTEGYQHIMAGSKCASLSFQELLLFSIAIAMIQCVASLYDIFDLIIKKEGKSNLMDIQTLYSLIYHLAVTIPLLIAGQTLQNEFYRFNKALARLACEVSLHETKSETRQIRDLNRLVTTNPVAIKFGTFTLGMYLLPMMMSLAATYIVVMLQFNHVI